MKLWILRPVECLNYNDDPWDPWYDKAFGFVVRAECEGDAREMAHSESGDEDRKIPDIISPWLESKYSTCEELTIAGQSGVIIRDFAAA